MPSESAKVNITDTRLVKAHIKLIGEENDELKKQQCSFTHKARQAHKDIPGAKDKEGSVFRYSKTFKSTISCTEELLRQRTKMLDFYILNQVYRKSYKH